MPRTIMIGTKDPNITYLLQRYAEESGFQTSQICPDQDVLVMAHDLQPALIILDHESSDMLNDEIVQRLKHEPTTHNIPVVMYSYLDESPSDAHVDVDGYLPKAVLYNDFVAVLERVGLDQEHVPTQQAPGD